MANPYLEGNPYLVPKKKNTTGPQLVNMGLQLYSIKNAAGNKSTQYKIGESKAGEALEIPDSTVTPEGLEAFDFGKGGEVMESPAVAPEVEPALAGVSGDTATLIGESAPSAVDPDMFAGLDAFDFGTAATETGGAVSGTLTAAEAAELEGLGASTAGTLTAAEAGGATVGSIAGGVASAAPYVALYSAGKPILKGIMSKGYEDAGVDLKSNNFFAKQERVAMDSRGVVTPLYEELTGRKASTAFLLLTNPAGWLAKFLGI